jgi:hypothetical protein
MMAAARSSKMSLNFYHTTRRNISQDITLRCQQCLLQKFTKSYLAKISSPMAVPWLKRLVAGLSQRRPGFATGSIHVGSVVDKVALGQVFLRVLRFPLSVSFRHCSVFIYHRPHEVCDSSDQAAHYHHLGPKLGDSFMTRNFGCLHNNK